MKLLSVSVSTPREIIWRGNTVSTGIFKIPVHGRVRLRRNNLEGDRQADLEVHGGADKAVYAYPLEHYPYWEERLGRLDFVHGQFGENFTTLGLHEEKVHIGDVFRVGEALIEVTQPRLPCFKLGIRLEREDFPEMFKASGKTGFYLRVLKEGEVGAGDNLALVSSGEGALSVRELWRLACDGPPDRPGIKAALALPVLPPNWRDKLSRRLAGQ